MASHRTRIKAILDDERKKPPRGHLNRKPTTVRVEYADDPRHTYPVSTNSLYLPPSHFAKQKLRPNPLEYAAWQWMAQKPPSQKEPRYRKRP